MSFSKDEEKIIKPFYIYITTPKPEKELYLLKWKYGTSIYATGDTIYESDNELDFDDPDYEDFISIIMRVRKLASFNPRDGFRLEWLEEGVLFEFNYHNFPDEIYNSKGELISKKEV